MKKGRFATTAGVLLIAAALLLALYNVWDNLRVGRLSEDILKAMSQEMSTDPIPGDGRESGDGTEYPDYVLDPNMDMPVKTVDGHSVVGMLSIPAIDRVLPVFDEWSYANLKLAPCRYAGTAYLGNLIICAHNYERHFGLIKNLRYGDKVYFTDMDGNRFEYEVEETEILQPIAVDEMKHSDSELTLFTCTIGGRTRVTVRCNSIA